MLFQTQNPKFDAILSNDDNREIFGMHAGSAKQGSGTSFEPCFAPDDGLQKLLAKQSANDLKVCRTLAYCLKVVIQSNH